MIPHNVYLIVVGIIGKMGSGKTTVAKYLIENYNFLKLSFADALKKMLIEVGILTHSELYPTKTPYARKMLQVIGTDIIRNKIDSDYWVKKFKERVIEICQLCKPVNNDNVITKPQEVRIVVDDIRFPNEFFCVVNELNGKIIKIVRNDNSNCYNHFDECLHLHESERYVNMFPYDYVINNNGSLRNLFELIDFTINKLLTEKNNRQQDTQEIFKLSFQNNIHSYKNYPK